METNNEQKETEAVTVKVDIQQPVSKTIEEIQKRMLSHIIPK